MDIYDNIDNFDEVDSVTKIHNENKDLKIKVERYSAEMEKLRRDYNELYNNHENLLKNYTSMLLTAKAEIARKTETIMMINKEKDQMFLRMICGRNNGKGRKNNNINKADKEFTDDLLNSQENVLNNPINKVLKENRFQACQFSSDEEDSVTKSSNKDNQEHKLVHTTRDSRDVRHKLRDRHTERVNERDRHREKGDRERNYEREGYNRDYYHDRRRLDPDRHQRGRAPHRDYPENKYNRNKSRQRILRSPENGYDRSKSRDRRNPVEYTNEKVDHHSLKHKIEDSNDNVFPKRRRVESGHEVHRQVIKCIEEVPSCQSPDDYNDKEEKPNEHHIVKEIRATSISHLEDPRQKHPKYVKDVDQKNVLSLTAVSGQNVEIKQILGYDLDENNKCNKKSDGYVTETTNVYSHSELSNMSVESGEIVDNIIHPDSSQTSNVCNKLSYHHLPQSPTPDFDEKSFKISKRQSAKNVSSAQIGHRPSPVELLYKEFESSLGHSSNLDKPSHKKAKPENLEVNKHPKYVQDFDQQNEISLTAVSGQNVEIKQIPGYELDENNKCNKISDGDIITETPNVCSHSDLPNMSVELGEIVDNIIHPDSSQKTSNVCNKLSYHHLPQSPTTDFDGKSFKISKRPSAKNVSSAQIGHGPSPVELLYKESGSSSGHSCKSHKPSHKKAKSKNLEENNDWKLMNDETDSFIPKESKTKSKTNESLKKSIVEGDLELSDDNSDHVFKGVNKNKRHKTASSRKETSDIHHKESKNEKKCEDSTKLKSVSSKDDKLKHKTKSDHKEKDAYEKDNKHKPHDKEEKPKSTDKEVKVRNKSKDKSNKTKSKDSMSNKDNHETNIFHNDKADHQIKTTSEKEVKNGHKGKEHVKDKNSHKIKSESKHTNKIKRNGDTKSITEKEAKGKSKHEDSAIENASKVKYDHIDQSPTEDKIREILAESCKKQSILEKENSKTKNRNIIEKMSDLFGDNSLITPEDLNIGSQSPCDIYSEFIIPGSPSDTQNPDDDLWNVASGAQTKEDIQKTDKKLGIIKLRKVTKETKSHDNVTEVYKDINRFPVSGEDNPSISDSSTKENSRKSISSHNYKIDNKESEKHDKDHYKLSNDITDSQNNTFSENLTEARVENIVTNDIAISDPVDLSNITNAHTVNPENGVIRLEPDISQNEPDIVKTVIISTGTQQLGLLDNENCSSLPSAVIVNNSKDAIPNKALVTSTPERDISEIITSAVNSITNLSELSSGENTPANHQSLNDPEDVDKPDIRIRIVRKGRRSLKK